MKRVFIALNPPDEVKGNLNLIQNSWGSSSGKLVKWVNPVNLHLTFHFLGEISDDLVKKVGKLLVTIAPKTNHIYLTLGGLGAFPSPGRASVAYIEVFERDGAALSRLHEDISIQLKIIGLNTGERPLAPHVTLGRLRRPASITTNWYKAKTIPWTVNSIELMESKLRPTGPEYSCLISAKLG